MHVNKLSCCYFALVEINFCTCETVEHFCILRFEPKSHWRTPLLKSSAVTVQVAVCVALTAKSFSPHGKVYREPPSVAGLSNKRSGLRLW